MKKIVPKILMCIYLLSMLGIYLNVLTENWIIGILTSIISLGFIYTIYKLNKKHNFFNKILNSKYIICFSIIVAILLRCVLLLFKYNEVSSDEATFFWSAYNLAKGVELDNAKYIALFPYLFGYINVLSHFFKIFGSSLYTALVLNIVIDLIGAYFCYLFGKKIFDNKNSGIIFLLIWLFNPFQIIWIMRVMPLTIVNTSIMICLYIFLLLLDAFDNKKYIVMSIILGLTTGISNSFRPIMIIFLIAVLLYYFYLILVKKGNIKKLIISFLLIVVCYKGYNNFNSNLVENVTNLKLPQNTSGWSIYVGSNIPSNGSWFPDSDFSEFLYDDDMSPTEIQNYFMKKGIDNYKSYNLMTIIKFMANKLHFLTEQVHVNSYENIENRIINYNNIYYLVFKVYTTFYWFTLILINILFINKFKLQKYDNRLIPYLLLIIGLLLSHLLVEVHPRYFIPTIVPMMITMGYLINEYLYNKKITNNSRR